VRLKFSEKRKHQIVGLLAVIAMLAVILPAYFKQSNHGLDEKIHMAVSLPPKPSKPSVDASSSDNTYKLKEVASLDLSRNVEQATNHQKTQIQAMLISSNRVEDVKKHVTYLNETPAGKKNKDPIIETNKSQMVSKTSEVSKAKYTRKLADQNQYIVQLASFTVEKNALNLVRELQKKGFKAEYDRFDGKKSTFYRVFVGGHMPKHDAKMLKNKLVQSVQLDGVIVRRGMS
tara:strand:+ start:47 stop:739 length:693 start_codon:yes stop_codon:yes gene_type:complete